MKFNQFFKLVVGIGISATMIIAMLIDTATGFLSLLVGGTLLLLMTPLE